MWENDDASSEKNEAIKKDSGISRSFQSLGKLLVKQFSVLDING